MLKNHYEMWPPFYPLKLNDANWISMGRARVVDPVAIDNIKKKEYFSVEPTPQCLFCDMKAKLFACGKCKVRLYCSKVCQQQDWKRHQTVCLSVSSWSKKALMVETSTIRPRDEDWKSIFANVDHHIKESMIHPNNIFLLLTSGWHEEIPSTECSLVSMMLLQYRTSGSLIQTQLRKYLELGLKPRINDDSCDFETKLLEEFLKRGCTLSVPCVKYVDEVLVSWVCKQGCDLNAAFQTKFFDRVCYQINTSKTDTITNVKTLCNQLGHAGLLFQKVKVTKSLFSWSWCNETNEKLVQTWVWEGNTLYFKDVKERLVALVPRVLAEMVMLYSCFLL